MSSPAWRFGWGAFVTDDLLAELTHAAGARAADVPPEAARLTLTPLVARCLVAAGGLPVWRGADPPPGSDRTRIGRDLLAESLAHAARGRVSLPVANGLVIDDMPASSPMSGRARAVAVVHVNTADTAALDALPGIGTVLASRIVEERLRRGPFFDAADLAERVHGLGKARLHTLRTVLSYADPEALPWVPPLSGRFADDVAMLVALQPGATPLARLEHLLRRTAEAAARAPHPSTRAGRIRPAVPPALPALSLRADAVVPLVGADYRTHLLAAFAAAATRIEVCMFHIAWPGPAHPTGELLDALVAARERGVQVRVLLDQDRETDPYRSTVINGRAARRLLAGGIEVRCDAPDRLLHAKVVIVDERLVVVGSHNWSVGSYERVDDVSLALLGSAAATAMRLPFETRWSSASPWPLPGATPGP